jgi:hypothetical protein
MLRFWFIVAAFALFATIPAPGRTQAPMESGQAAQPIVGSSATQQTNQQEIVLPIFAFHSGFWVNLHHFLYEQARQGGQARELGRGARPSTAAAPPLSPEEERRWKDAVSYYAATLAGQNLEFNGEMVLLNNRLAELEGCREIDSSSSPQCVSGLREGLVNALEEAAPIYRAHWWPEQDRANRAWIAAVGELIRRYGTAVSRRLARAYQAPWPANPIRVDVAPYAGPWGAYGSLNPLHVVIAGGDPRNQGLAALAVVFDEASQAFAADVVEALESAFHDQNKLVRRDLWQAMLFYTAAVTVERVLNASGGAKESPAEARWVREGLRARGWQAYTGLLERVWQPYLDRQIDFPTAIQLLVEPL